MADILVDVGTEVKALDLSMKIGTQPKPRQFTHAGPSKTTRISADGHSLITSRDPVPVCPQVNPPPPPNVRHDTPVEEHPLNLEIQRPSKGEDLILLNDLDTVYQPLLNLDSLGCDNSPINASSSSKFFWSVAPIQKSQIPVRYARQRTRQQRIDST